MARLSSKSKAKMYETVADIAFEAGRHYYYSGNSREDMQHFIFLAEKFHKEYDKEINADWEEVGKDYMDEIEKFIERELKPVKKLVLNYPHAFDNPWDDIEVQKVRDDGQSTYVLDDDDDHQPGDFWSVYARQAKGGAMCIADFPDEKSAIDCADMIRKAVIAYRDNGFLEMYTQKHLLDAINEQLNKLTTHSWNDSYRAALNEVKTFVNRIIR
jgi:hypothetical protein